MNLCPYVICNDDIDSGALKSKTGIFKLLLKDDECMCFYDILVKIKELPDLENSIINHNHHYDRQAYPG